MPNIGYFEIPADDVKRARKFYTSLFGWEIGPTAMPGSMPPAMEYQDVKTGEPKEGTLSMGGMYKRQMPGTPIIPYVMVEGFDRVVAKVEKLGGKVVMPKMMVEGVGPVVIIEDTEGNALGIWEPVMEK
jgi:predicted enzyme related to lactoylglutathione lyase